MAIKSVIRLENDMVMVFSRSGEQISEYQGKYDEVRENILIDAPQDTLFAHGFTDTGKIRRVERDEW